MAMLKSGHGVMCAVSLAMAACGGGAGGGSSAGSTPPVSVASSSSSTASFASDITVANQDRVANVALRGASIALNTYDSVVNGASGLEGLNTEVVSYLRKFLTASAASATSKCDAGGTYAYVGLFAGVSGRSAGDTYNVVLTDCAAGTSVWNGKLALEWGVPDLKTGSLAAHVAFSDLRVTAAAASAVYNGSYNYEYTQDSAGSSELIRNGNISAGMATAGYEGRLSLSDMRVGKLISARAGTYSFSITTRINATSGAESLDVQLDGAPSFYLLSTGDDVYAAGGKLKVTGRNGTLYLSFRGQSNVTLELDLNGDGVIDSTKSTTLSNLFAS